MTFAKSTLRRAVVGTFTALLIVGALLTGLTGCESNKRGTGDAPVSAVNGQRGGDDSPAHVTNMPDHFANVAAKCLAGFPGKAVVVNTREAPAVVFDAPAGMCR